MTMAILGSPLTCLSVINWVDRQATRRLKLELSARTTGNQE